MRINWGRLPSEFFPSNHLSIMLQLTLYCLIKQQRSKTHNNWTNLKFHVLEWRQSASVRKRNDARPKSSKFANWIVYCWRQLLSLQQFLVTRVALDISAVTLMYSRAHHKDVSVNDRPHKLLWSHKNIILYYIILYYIILYYIILYYIILYYIILYYIILY